MKKTVKLMALVLVFALMAVSTAFAEAAPIVQNVTLVHSPMMASLDPETGEYVENPSFKGQDVGLNMIYSVESDRVNFQLSLMNGDETILDGLVSLVGSELYFAEENLDDAYVLPLEGVDVQQTVIPLLQMLGTSDVSIFDLPSVPAIPLPVPQLSTMLSAFVTGEGEKLENGSMQYPFEVTSEQIQALLKAIPNLPPQAAMITMVNPSVTGIIEEEEGLSIVAFTVSFNDEPVVSAQLDFTQGEYDLSIGDVGDDGAIVPSVTLSLVSIPEENTVSVVYVSEIGEGANDVYTLASFTDEDMLPTLGLYHAIERNEVPENEEEYFLSYGKLDAETSKEYGYADAYGLEGETKLLSFIYSAGDVYHGITLSLMEAEEGYDFGALDINSTDGDSDELLTMTVENLSGEEVGLVHTDLPENPVPASEADWDAIGQMYNEIMENFFNSLVG